MTHNTKVVGSSHNIDGIQKMMSTTNFVWDGQIVQNYLNASWCLRIGGLTLAQSMTIWFKHLLGVSIQPL